MENVQTMLHYSDSLKPVQAIRFRLRVSDTLERLPMETKGERRLRKLRDLCAAKGGHVAVADKAGVSEQSLDQILKGVLLPAKADGSRSPRMLGDAIARKIEAAYQLESGWFDSDHATPPLPDEILRMAVKLASIEDQMVRAAILAMAATATDVALERQADSQQSHAPKKRRGPPA